MAVEVVAVPVANTDSVGRVVACVYPMQGHRSHLYAVKLAVAALLPPVVAADSGGSDRNP